MSIINYVLGAKTLVHIKRPEKNLIARSSKLVAVLLLSLLAAGVGGVLAEYQLSKTITNNSKIILGLKKKERLLEKTLADLEQAQQQIADLVAGRIPKLRPLIYDQAIPISERYVRDVIFTQTGPEPADRIFEYRVVLVNHSNWIVTPKVQILLFNELGIQVGVSNITHHLATNRVNSSSLMTGEIRIYSSTISLNKQRKVPRYFLFEFQDT